MAISSAPGVARSAVRCWEILLRRESNPAPVWAETVRPEVFCLGGRSAFVKIGRTLAPRGGHSSAQGSEDCVESIRASTKSAVFMAALVRAIPSCSKRSEEGRRPAVSIKRTEKPASRIDSSTVSLVVPGMELTRARSRPRRALRRLDFPAFGGPARTRRYPERSR